MGLVRWHGIEGCAMAAQPSFKHGQPGDIASVCARIRSQSKYRKLSVECRRKKLSDEAVLHGYYDFLAGFYHFLISDKIISI